MLSLDYTYEYRPELDTFTYRRFFIEYPELYGEGDSLEEANSVFKARIRDITIFALDRKWVTVKVITIVEPD